MKLLLTLFLTSFLISCGSSNEQSYPTKESKFDSLDYILQKEQTESKIKDTTISVQPGIITNSKKDSVAIDFLENKIIYDGDFKPTIFSKIRNNTKYTLIGIGYYLNFKTDKLDKSNPNSNNCDGIHLQQKIQCKPHSTTIIKIKFSYDGNKTDCNLDYAFPQPIEYVFSNGKKYSVNGWLDYKYFNEELLAK